MATIQYPLGKVEGLFKGFERFDERGIMNKRGIILLVALFVMALVETAFTQSEDEAIRLNKQGEGAHRQGKYEEALRYFEEALKLNEGTQRTKAYSHKPL